MFFKKKKEPQKNIESSEILFHDDNIELQELIEIIKKISGIDLTPKKEVLKERLSVFAKNHQISSFKILGEKVLSDSNFRQTTLNLVTINETYFYREIQQLKLALEEIKNSPAPIKILSAPCSSGEEVYSLGMLSYENKINPSSINITGIDISSNAIKKATEGIYSERSLHKLNEDLKQAFFTKINEGFRIKTQYLPQCSFKVVNIFDDEFLNLGRFDIIFSRNMLIYFDEKYREKSIQKFHSILKENGRLYVGHADLIPQSDLFKKITHNNLVFYQKN